MGKADWSALKLRHENAIKVAPPRSKRNLPTFRRSPARMEMMKSSTPVQIIDARANYYTTKAQDITDEAVRRDPERLDDWFGTLSNTEAVVPFCVYGFHIGAVSSAVQGRP